MKELTDEEIQRLLDDNMMIEPSATVELYQKVFNELSKLPDIHVEPLANDVIYAITKRSERILNIKTYFAILTSIILVFCTFIAGAYVVDSKLAIKILSLLNDFKWVFLIIALLLNAISLLEQKLRITASLAERNL